MSERKVNVSFRGYDTLCWNVNVDDILSYESMGDSNCCAVQSIGGWIYSDWDNPTKKEIYQDFLRSLIELHDHENNRRVIFTAADVVQSLRSPSLYGFCMETGWHKGPSHFNPKSGNRVVLFETNINHLRKLKI